jgi:hypothetical protein
MFSGRVERRPSRAFVAAVVAACAVTFLALAWAGSARATVWLCKPGTSPDPCTPGLSTTIFNAPLTQALRVVHPRAVRNPPIDCFYVYPTVSDEKTGNSDLTIQDTETSIALYQASRYSQYCRVWAPMYRQVTLAGASLAPGATATSRPDPTLGPRDVENALKDYLRHFNHGRGIVFIGHSQGSGVLETVLAKTFDRSPRLRRQLVSAILLGGNVLQRRNSGIGGTFKHIPACRSDAQIRCVIAYSTFDEPVPSDSLFGRPRALGGQPAPPKDDTVLCTNPGNLAGGRGVLDVIQPSAPFAPGSSIAAGIALLNWRVPSPPTVYWAAPGSYSAQCVTSNGAHVLMVTPLGGAQTPSPSPTPEFGLHLLDANIALGNLISIVHSESRAFAARSRHGRR